MQFINRPEIESQLLAQNHSQDHYKIREILQKAKELKGINKNEVLTLLSATDPQLCQEIFDTAAWAKNEIYGNRLVLFAPLYISNLCENECLYCAFRAANKKLARKALRQDEVAAETQALIEQGHKRVLLVAGESYGQKGLEYVLESINTIYSVHLPVGNIRRINVNIAPLTLDEFKILKQQPIGTYQLFQETYHQPTYE
ncbi:MAG: radical SAM protein, partial [Pseudomonadota bacterium]